ncbi:MAG: hypothetical protein MUF49_18665 [Oculatellaceae cyanobacterium Prado106]|jgi:hypothetical protein|nr:hypothetical protein [Oculatellaceae cyanobacterium Prado106]
MTLSEPLPTLSSWATQWTGVHLAHHAQPPHQKIGLAKDTLDAQKRQDFL